MAFKCEPIRSQLQALQEQLDHTPKFLESGTGATRKINPMWTNLDSHVQRTRMSLQACEETD